MICFRSLPQPLRRRGVKGNHIIYFLSISITARVKKPVPFSNLPHRGDLEGPFFSKKKAIPCFENGL
jgi:hypothetical protein